MPNAPGFATLDRPEADSGLFDGRTCMNTMQYLPEATNDRVFALIGSPWGVLAVWLVIINVVTFLVFGLDKWKAKRKVRREQVRRVPEKTLFLLAALGGGLGALIGMRVWHHKTLHRSFRYGIPAILLVEAAGLFYLWWRFAA